MNRTPRAHAAPTTRTAPVLTAGDAPTASAPGAAPAGPPAGHDPAKVLELAKALHYCWLSTTIDHSKRAVSAIGTVAAERLLAVLNDAGV